MRQEFFTLQLKTKGQYLYDFTEDTKNSTFGNLTILNLNCVGDA